MHRSLFMPENDISPVSSTVHFRGASHTREGLQERVVLPPSGSKAPPFVARFWGVVVRATFFTKGSRFGVDPWTRAVPSTRSEKSGPQFP